MSAQIIITKNGKPISKLTPVTRKSETRFGAHKGQIKITGDIIVPLDAARGKELLAIFATFL